MDSPDFHVPQDATENTTSSSKTETSSEYRLTEEQARGLQPGQLLQHEDGNLWVVTASNSMLLKRDKKYEGTTQFTTARVESITPRADVSPEDQDSLSKSVDTDTLLINSGGSSTEGADSHFAALPGEILPKDTVIRGLVNHLGQSKQLSDNAKIYMESVFNDVLKDWDTTGE